MQHVRFVTWLAANAAALAVALWIVPGLRIDGPSSGWEEVQQKIVPLLVVAVVLGTITSLVKPVLTLLSVPFIILTLGLFLLVVNAAVLGLTAWVYARWLEPHVEQGFHVDGFWSAVLGGLVIAIVGSFVRGRLEDR